MGVWSYPLFAVPADAVLDQAKVDSEAIAQLQVDIYLYGVY